MSILIKGMEMPTNCYKCDMRRRDGMDIVCPIAHERFSVADVNILEYRLKNCPLVPVPPHGDLIDRDAARASIKPWSPEDERNGCTFDTVKKLMYTMLDNAPTIILAESITAEEEKNDKQGSV